MRIPRLNLNFGIALVLLLTPLLNINEVRALIDGSLRHHSAVETPIYVKLTKDVGMLLLLIFVLIDNFRRLRITTKSISLLAIGLSGLIPLIGFAIASNSVLFLAGLRWALPLFLGAALIGKIRRPHIDSVAHILSWLFLISFLVQCGQLAFASNYYGVNLIGLPGRVGGFFIIPSTAAQFACVTFMFAFYYLPLTDRKRTLVLWLAPISALMAASATGVMVMTAVILVALAKRYAFIMLPLAAVAVILVWFFLPQITNRPDIYLSVQERGQIMIESIEDAELISTKFGRSTNAGVLLSESQGKSEGVIADSFYIAVLSNTGIVGIFLLIVFLGAWIYWVVSSKRYDALCATIIWGLFAFTTQITESFPTNLVLSLLIGYYMSNFNFPREFKVVNCPNDNLLATPRM